MIPLLICFTHRRQSVSSEKTANTCNKINILMDNPQPEIKLAGLISGSAAIEQ